MKNKKREDVQVFAEVLTDYTDPETGNIAIDCYPDTDPNAENARKVAEVTPDGEVIRGDNPEITEADFQCPLVIEAIKEVQAEQEQIKQKVVDQVIEEIKRDIASGDTTVLDELLKSVSFKKLVHSLPEEKWSDYFTTI